MDKKRDDFMTNNQFEFYNHLFRAKDVMDSLLTKELKKHNISLSEFNILKFLFDEGQTSILHVCHKLVIQNSSMTYIVSKLEEKGFVKRTTDKNDRRRILLKLSDKGNKKITKLFPIYTDTINRVLTVVSENDLNEITKNLILLEEQAEKILNDEL